MYRLSLGFEVNMAWRQGGISLIFDDFLGKISRSYSRCSYVIGVFRLFSSLLAPCLNTCSIFQWNRS